jgi:hypothetical protein
MIPMHAAAIAGSGPVATLEPNRLPIGLPYGTNA